MKSSNRKGYLVCCPHLEILALLIALSVSGSLVSEGLCQARGGDRTVTGLVELYGVTSGVILYGGEDEYAANLLLQTLQPRLKGMRAVAARGEKLKSAPLVIYVGSFTSNPLARQAFKSLGYSLKWEALTEGSYVLKTFRKAGKTTIFACGKDRVGTLYAVYDLKNYYLRFEPAGVFLHELNLVEKAHLRYRCFYNDVEQTRWSAMLPTTPSPTTAAEKTLPASDQSLSELKPLVEWMSELRLNGLILRGLFEEGRGGASAAVELCEYAEERGIRIIPAVGLGASGGFVRQKGHPYNLDSWAEAHPQLRAVDEYGRFRDNTLCPEKPENRNWYHEGFKWLYENFKLSGVHLDMRALFACYCNDCKRARLAMKTQDSDYFKDLARMVEFAAQELHRLDPNYWVFIATDTGFDYDAVQRTLSLQLLEQRTGAMPSFGEAAFPPEFVQTLPEFVAVSWRLDQMYESDAWPSPFKAPARHNIGVLEWGSVSSVRQAPFLFQRIQEIAHHAIPSSVEGLMMPGEAVPLSPFVEINYRTFAEYAFNPATENSNFFKFKLSHWFGGEKPSQLLLQALDLMDPDKGITLEQRQRAISLVRQAVDLAEESGKARWNLLLHDLEALTIR